jgi:segregation and condensation protein B
MNYKAIIEGLLFVSGDEGLSLNQMCNIIEKNKDDVKEIIKELYKDYSQEDRGINIEFLGDRFKLTTKPEHKLFYKKIIEDEQNTTLSQSALEVLAIIAYNAPITRIQIDEIRGVNSSYVVRKLLLKGLIEDVGKSEVPGKPILYNVTKRFLDYFGLGSIDELPRISFNNENEDVNKDLFSTKYSE